VLLPVCAVLRAASSEALPELRLALLFFGALAVIEVLSSLIVAAALRRVWRAHRRVWAGAGRDQRGNRGRDEAGARPKRRSLKDVAVALLGDAGGSTPRPRRPRRRHPRGERVEPPTAGLPELAARPRRQHPC
jgi:hypothetical protein